MTTGPNVSDPLRIQEETNPEQPAELGLHWYLDPEDRQMRGRWVSQICLNKSISVLFSCPWYLQCLRCQQAQVGQEKSCCLAVGDRRWWSVGRCEDWTTTHMWLSLELSLFFQHCSQMLQLLLHLTDKNVTPDSHLTPGAKSFQRNLALIPGTEHLSERSYRKRTKN